MPVYHHGEEKKKGSPKKVRRSCQKGGNARVANVRRQSGRPILAKEQTGLACVFVQVVFAAGSVCLFAYACVCVCST